MGLKLSIIGLAGAGLLASACATQNHQMARADAAAMLANAPAEQPTALSRTGAEAFAWNDRWTAANLFERSVDKENSVRARFDLAIAYEATGRTAEAMALYRGLVRDGQYVTGVQDVNYADRSAPIRRFNVAEESARRLAVLQMTATARPAAVFAQNTATGAAAAGEFGTPTAAVVGGTPVVEHRISDAEALRRDAAGTP
jgi:hypothetical protein